MARIRTIKPEFPLSESMGRVSREARLLFILLWTVADDFGRSRASSRMLASLLYPYDLDAGTLLDHWLVELEQQSCIRRYEADGNQYLEIVKWLEHQRIDHPTKSRLPEFRETSRGLAKDSVVLAPRARAQDLGPRTKDLGDSEAKASAVSRPETPLDLKSEIWRVGKNYLGKNGIDERRAGELLGKWRKSYGNTAVIDALAQAETCAASEPVAYIEASLRKRGSNGHATTPIGKMVEGGARLLAKREHQREVDLAARNGSSKPLLGSG